MGINNFSGNILLVAGIPIKGFAKGTPITWQRQGKDWGILTLRLIQTSRYNMALTGLVSGTDYEVIEGCGNRITMRCSQTGPFAIRFPVLGVMDGRQDFLNFSHCAVDGYPKNYNISEEISINDWSIICTGSYTLPLGELIPKG